MKKAAEKSESSLSKAGAVSNRADAREFERTWPLLSRSYPLTGTPVSERRRRSQDFMQ